MIRRYFLPTLFLLAIVNANTLPLTQRYFHKEDMGYEYTRGTFMIVLSDESLETYLMDDNIGNFVSFKRTQGYNVEIRTFSEVGGSAENLRAFLQWYFETQDSLLEYVLLVGDIDGSFAIPSFYIGSYNENEDDVTDYPYTFFGNDVTEAKYFVGRWSIRGIEDLIHLIKRSIQYIKMENISDYSFLNRGLLVAGNYNGEDDAPNTWPVTPVWTSKWLQDELHHYGYPQVDTAFFNLQNQNTENPQISASWNEGVGIINYRGWGDANGWHKPYFHKENINELTNGWNLPIVMSFVCNTGDFGNPTIPQCFGEWMLKAGSISNPKGAAAMVGPSDLDTDTRFNNVMCGVMWDELLEERIPELGPALHAGKQAVQNEFPDYSVNGQDIGEFYHHVYGVLGDPSLPVWLKEPEDLSADIEETPILLQSHLSTAVYDSSGTPIMDVVGALIYNSELVGRGLSNHNGILDIDFDGVSEGETIKLYLNKPQFFQKQIDLTFSSDDGSEFIKNGYEIHLKQNSYSYNFFDSNSSSENAPVYNWIEISDIGTNLNLTDDSHISDVEIGFDFQFYGQIFSSMTVCSNGWASFLPCLDGNGDGNCNSISHFFNNSITHPIGPYGMLAPFYDDLDDNQGSEPFNVYAYQDLSNQRFIVQWENIANGQHDEDCILGDDTSCPKETFQFILSQNGEILFQYKEVNNVDDHGCTIGIESPDKNHGIEYIFFNQQNENASELSNELAIKFIPISLAISATTKPVDFIISKNFPNPFNPTTTIQYFLPMRTEVETVIYDALGRKIAQLENKLNDSGVHKIVWNGLNNLGQEMPSGVYLYKVISKDHIQSGKMVLVR